MSKNLTIGPEQLGGAIEQILKEYGDEVNAVLDQELDLVAKAALRRIREKTRGWGTGRYSKGWSIKKETHAGGVFKTQTIYNKALPGLPHLLEFSHPIKNQAGDTGKTSTPNPHIAAVNDWVAEELPKRVQKRLNKL